MIYLRTYLKSHVLDYSLVSNLNIRLCWTQAITKWNKKLYLVKFDLNWNLSWAIILHQLPQKYDKFRKGQNNAGKTKDKIGKCIFTDAQLTSVTLLNRCIVVNQFNRYALADAKVADTVHPFVGLTFKIQSTRQFAILYCFVFRLTAYVGIRTLCLV